MKRVLLLIFTLFSVLTATAIYAQGGDARYTISGKVTDKGTGEPIPYAQVILKETSQWGVTNDEGIFKIESVFAGDYTLESVVLGYVTYRLPITVSKDITTLNIKMSEDNLKLEQVVVTAVSAGTMNSSSKIDKTAIEHVQASSISDVMQLLPGNVVSNPDLTTANTIQIRSLNEDANSNRGVGLLINGAQVSNDASMSSIVKSGVAALPEVDFRSYSTDNIESIQVLKGVVSAEYGDVTSGAVMITTKAGRTPFEVRFKTDPRTKAAAINKGFSLSKDAGYLNLDLDYAHATSDLRSPVKTYARTNAGITYSNTFTLSNKPFRFNARLNGSFVNNNVKTDPDVAKDDFTEISDNNVMLSLYGNWMVNSKWLSVLNYNFSASYANNTTQEYEVLSGGMLPTTNVTTEGISEGYLMEINNNFDQRVHDVPLYLNGKVSGVLNKKAGKNLFKTTLGIEWNSKGNLGDGVYYVGPQPQYFRQQAYSDDPFLHNFAAFLEEKITVPVGETKLEMSLGARFNKMMIEGYDYAPTIDPRLNGRYVLVDKRHSTFFKHFALRGGWGIMQKLPTLSLLYPGELYIDNAIFTYNNTTTGQQLAVIDTRITPNYLDYNIEAAKTRNMEVGFDLNIGGVEMGFTYFNEKLSNGITDNRNISPRTVNYYSDVTDVNAAPKLEDGKVMIKNDLGNYVEAPYYTREEYVQYSNPDNRAKIDKWGVEYEFNFGKIKSLNTSVLMSGAYIKTTNSYSGEKYAYSGGADPVNPALEFPYIAVFAGNDELGTIDVRDRLNTNVSFVTNIPSIRMVVSLTLQCVWMDRYWSEFENGEIYYEDANGSAIYEDFSGESTLNKLYKDPIAYIDFEGTVRPFSDYHTTSDPDLKRRLAQMRETTTLSYYYAVNSYNPYFMANIRVTKEIGDLAAISFYANNFTNSNPIMVNDARPNSSGLRKNTNIYFGAELKLTF